MLPSSLAGLVLLFINEITSFGSLFLLIDRLTPLPLSVGVLELPFSGRVLLLPLRFRYVVVLFGERLSFCDRLWSFFASSVMSRPPGNDGGDAAVLFPPPKAYEMSCGEG